MRDDKATIQLEESDASLIKRCLNGSDEAFDKLYARYRLPLYSYLNRLLASHNQEADDLFQKTWFKASESLDRYKHKEKFLAWLCRIAHNLVMDFFRSHVSDETEEVSENLTIHTASPEEIMMNGEFDAALKVAITQLPQEQQNVIKLRLDGIPFKEIADRQKISLNTALGRMHYAIMNLRKLLEEHL